MDDGYWPYSIGLFFLFVILEAVFYGFGSAVQNMNAANLEREAGEGNKKAEKLLMIAGRPSRFINSIRIVSNAIGMFIGAYMIGRWSRQLEETVPFLAGETGRLIHGAVLVAVGILALVLLISFGIVIPKRCAAKYPEEWGYALLPFISVVIIPLMPFIWAVISLSTVVLKLLGVDISASEENVTEEEIMSMVNEGHEQGVLDAREAEMIQNIFELDDKNAGDIMTHRKNIIGISGATNLRDAISFMVGEPVSRYPVYDGSIEYITGILHFKDAMKFHTMEKYDSWLIKDIPGLLRTARFIPETRGINLLFRSMQAEHLQMVIVVDEYGETAGLVAMEDILEEIVGNIQDEYDKDVQLIRGDADNGYLMDGMAPLSEVKDTLEITLEDEEYDTLNGLLISRLDRIPADGERFEIMAYGYLFQILKVENKMIRLVRITKSKEEEKE